MNIAQIAAFQTKRLEGKMRDQTLSGVSGSSFEKDKPRNNDFTAVFGSTLEKNENSKLSKNMDSKPVKRQNALRQPENKGVDFMAETDKANAELVAGDETNQIIFLQIADLLKLLGISVNEGFLSQAGGSVQENSQPQALTGLITQEPVAGADVLRLIKMLEMLTGNGTSNNVTPFLQELKGLSEAQINGLSSLRDGELLTKLVKVLEKALEKALGESPLKTANAHASTVGPKPLFPVIESVSDNFSGNVSGNISSNISGNISGSLSGKEVSESGTFTDNRKIDGLGSLVDMNTKGSDSFGSEASQDGDNGFGLKQSETTNRQDAITALSGNGFNAATDALGKEQPASVYKLTQGIFGQIAQKAKVFVSPGITEMQIQLKPDFLGRLNMSISSENGTVTARFSAENHTVKAIIEANLNSLKDTLNQQGIKVDQLVVDIGTHNPQTGFEHRQNMFRGYNSSKNNRELGSAEELDRIFGGEQQNGALKGYYGSTIEFTA